MEETTPQDLTEIIAHYGGKKMAIAVAMVTLWWRGDGYAAMLICGLPFCFSAFGRVLGLMLDGYSCIHVTVAILEKKGAAFCFVGFDLSARTQATDPCR